ncbi:MAG TPA: 4Fe-4S binding protein [Candidatus Aminicenantes bacterium]|nr:4Fe-4S binding protein [Candidatus Aminicenantes bacterium]
MKRKIIHIDPQRCNGCGACLPGCPEGALQVIDGQARLVSDLFCDGLGACLGTCPQGAITIETREAEPYDERKVMAVIVPQGTGTLRAHLRHLQSHGEHKLLAEALDYLRERGLPVPDLDDQEGGAAGTLGGGCPGSQLRDRRADPLPPPAPGNAPSALRTWPVQLHLLSPQAAMFDHADLLVAADCTAFAAGSFHADLLAGRVPLIFCPKLDGASEEYVEKLAAILAGHDIRSITVARMEVPCCGGTTAIVRAALARAGQAIPVREVVLGVDGTGRS